MKYVAVSAIWLGMGGTLTAMAYFGAITNDGIDAVMAMLFGGIIAVLGTLIVTQ